MNAGVLLPLLLVVPILAHADMYRCEENGGIVYRNEPCKGQRIITPRSATPTQKHELTEAEKVAADPECNFHYFKIGDDKGKQLAKNAGKECKNNRMLKLAGKGKDVTLDAYNMWKDHFEQMRAHRAGIAARIAIGAAQAGAREDAEYKYSGSSGLKYKYDLSRPYDQMRYETDLSAQMRDSMNIDIRRDRDRSMGQYGAGIKR